MAQGDKLTALVTPAPLLRAILAGEPALKARGSASCLSVDERSSGRMQIAAGAADLEVAVSAIEGVAEHGRGLGGSAEAQHALVPSLARQPVGLPARLVRYEKRNCSDCSDLGLAFGTAQASFA